MDLLFVDFPEDLLFPKSGWCLGYRQMASVLRNNGLAADILCVPRGLQIPAADYLAAEILRQKPKILGFSAFDVRLKALLNFIKELRKSGCRSHITLGGLGASFIAEKLLKFHSQIDSVVRGEGEYSILELAQRIRSKRGLKGVRGISYRDQKAIVNEPSRPLIENLDELPLPIFNRLSPKDKASPLHSNRRRIFLAASRGCYGRCGFCAIQTFYRACGGKVWRGRSPAGLMKELKTLIKLTKSKEVTFIDDNFMGPGQLGREHALSIAEAIASEMLGIKYNFACRPNDVHYETFKKLKKSGLTAVTLGIESMSERALQLFDKKIKPQANLAALEVLEKLGLFVEITFIFFHPLTSLREIRENLSLVRKVAGSKHLYFNSDQPFTEYIPLNGSELTRQYRQKRLLRGNYLGYEICYLDPRVKYIAECVKKLPVELLRKLRDVLSDGEGGGFEAIKKSLERYEYSLNMVKLPDLIEALSNKLQKTPSLRQRSVINIAREFELEKNKLMQIIGAILNEAGLGRGRPKK